jgi:glycine/D-amino acid oxidase-like deaminating enzyme
MKRNFDKKNWGHPPWMLDFVAAKLELPRTVDFAVIGGGFTGLAAAARLKQFAPDATVCLLEAEEFGAGSSGHTGGMALAESAVGDLPGLGDVLGGYRKILKELNVEGDIHFPGVYELGRTSPLSDTPIRWNDSGELCAVNRVPGGTINPGKVVSGLARAAEKLGVLLFERCGVEAARFGESVELQTKRGAVQAKKILFATNAYALELSGLSGRAEAAFTLAVATQELTDEVISEIGLSERKPFYTADLPYLWGRMLGNTIIFGCGLVPMKNWRKLDRLDIRVEEIEGLFARLEKRIRRLHGLLGAVTFTHRWGGPICIAEEWKPVFEQYPVSQDAIVLGAYSGHGVAQSVYLGSWAAEALLKKRSLPNWQK